MTLLIVSLGALSVGQSTPDETTQPGERAYAHFRSRYELYATIGDLNAEEFSDLRAMTVAGTEFNDEDVPFLADLLSLRSLDLTGTQVTNKGLKELGRLALPLENLVLADTRISDAGVEHLASLPRLDSLDLSGTFVSGRGIAQVLNFEGPLSSLKLGQGLTDDDLKVVPALRSLEVLHLPVDEVTPVGMQRIARSESLRELRLYGEGLSPKMLTEVASMTRLERLDVSGFGRLNDRALQIVAPMAALTHLNLSGTGVTDRGMRLLAKLRNITYLDISGTAVTDAGLKPLGEMIWNDEGAELALEPATRIAYLDISDTAIGDRGLEHLRLLALEHLDVSGTQVTNRSDDEFAGWKLKSLDISGDSAITDLAFLKSMPELERLNLSGRPRLMSQLNKLEDHPSLEVLDISATDFKDFATMKLMTLKNLRRLNAAGTQVTLESLVSVAQKTKLEYLNLAGTRIMVHGEERRATLPGVRISRSEDFSILD
ncbi:MAG: hypothetical protein AAGB93_14225 [Planctomycetota bacterium]